MVSAGARAYNGALGAQLPAGSRGRAPGGGSPLKPKVLQLLDVQWKWQNCLILPILPNPFCSANANSPEAAEFPNSPPSAAPCTVPPGAHAPLRPPLSAATANIDDLEQT